MKNEITFAEGTRLPRASQRNLSERLGIVPFDLYYKENGMKIYPELSVSSPRGRIVDSQLTPTTDAPAYFVQPYESAYLLAGDPGRYSDRSFNALRLQDTGGVGDVLLINQESRIWMTTLKTKGRYKTHSMFLTIPSSMLHVDESWLEQLEV